MTKGSAGKYNWPIHETAELSNGTWVSFGFTYTSTPHVTLNIVEGDARYIAYPSYVNTTGFYPYIWDDTAGAFEAVAKTVDYNVWNEGV